MSSAITLARPYARAAFELARSNGTLGEWADKLDFATVVAADSRIKSLLGNPNLKSAELQGLLLPNGEAADSVFAGFIGTLAANRRLVALSEIAQLFGDLKREHEKVLRVTVRSAVPVEAAQADALRAALKKRFDRDIELSTVIDPSVMGGAIIDAGDVVIDGSVRGRLARLQQALAQ